jgi:hypothetical protein
MSPQEKDGPPETLRPGKGKYKIKRSRKDIKKEGTTGGRFWGRRNNLKIEWRQDCKFCQADFRNRFSLQIGAIFKPKTVRETTTYWGYLRVLKSESSVPCSAL